MKKIYSSIGEAVRDLYGNERSVARRRRITGGDINEAFALTLDDGTTLFMKYNSPDAFMNLDAVYYGHPEADLAMTELFGGFPNSFYEAYKEYGNLDPGYKDRRDIYNLYQLLNHLNMFGGGYYASVRSILKRYT